MINKLIINSLMLIFSIVGLCFSYEPQFSIIQGPDADKINQNFYNIAGELRNLNSDSINIFNGGLILRNSNIIFSTTTGTYGIVFQDGSSMVSAGVGSVGVVVNPLQFSGNGTAGSVLNILTSSITLGNITQITNRSHTNLTDIGVYTHPQIDIKLDNLVTSTTTIMNNLLAEITNRQTADNLIAVDTTTLGTRLDTVANDTTTIAGKVSSNTSDIADLKTSTGSLQTQITSNDTDIANLSAATTTLRTDVNNNTSKLAQVATDTTTIAGNLTAETNARISADNNIAVATTTLQSNINSKVSKTGDTMTGSLTLDQPLSGVGGILNFRGDFTNGKFGTINFTSLSNDTYYKLITDANEMNISGNPVQKIKLGIKSYTTNEYFSNIFISSYSVIIGTKDIDTDSTLYVHGNIKANTNIDADVYKAKGYTGLTAVCDSGQVLSGGSYVVGIATSGTCANVANTSGNLTWHGKQVWDNKVGFGYAPFDGLDYPANPAYGVWISTPVTARKKITWNSMSEPFIKVESGGFSSQIQGIFSPQANGIVIYDDDNTWNGRLKLGVYGADIYSKGALSVSDRHIGIDISTPSYKLDVVGGAHFTSSMTVDGGYYGNGSNLTGLNATQIGDGSVSNTEFQYINSLTSNAQTQLNDKASLSNANTFTSSQTFQNANFSIGGSTFVVKGGKVLIGNIVTETPYKLQVQDCLTTGQYGSNTKYCNNLIVENEAYDNFRISKGYGALFLEAKGNYVSTTTYPNAGSIIFNTSNSSSPIERMRIYYNGNVGIGTTSPAYKLDVNGTGHFAGAVVMDSTLGVTGAITGNLNGNATTSSAFDHNPSGCSSGQYATDINADGSLVCGTPARGDNLGNHIATTSLNMNNFDIKNIKDIYNNGNLFFTYGGASKGIFLNAANFDVHYNFATMIFDDNNIFMSHNRPINFKETTDTSKLQINPPSYNNGGIYLKSSIFDINANNINANGNLYANYGINASSINITGTGVSGSNPLFKVAGSTMVVLNNGNVGIGTTSPQTKLDVNGDAQFGSGSTKSTFTASGVLRLATPLSSLHGGTGSNLSSAVAGGLPYFSGSGVMGSIAAGSSGQLLQSNGTSAPSWITATNTNTVNTIVKRDGSGNFSAGTITANLTGNVTGNLTGNVTGSSSLNVLKAGDVITGQLTLLNSTLTVTGNAFSVGTSTFVVKNGNVGIGTTSPAYKLDVNGDGRFTSNLKIGNYTLPTADGSNGQFLKTDGSGTVSWGSPAGGGDAVLSATQTWTGVNTYQGNSIYNSSITINANSNQQYALTIDTNNNSSDGYIVDITTNGVLSYNGAVFFAKRSSEQTLRVNNTYYKVDWNNIIINKNGYYDTTNDKYIVTQKGCYLITVNANLFKDGDNTVSNKFLALNINGLTYQEGSTTGQNKFAELNFGVAVPACLNVNDYIETFVKYTGGSNLVLNSSYSYFAVIRIF